MRNGRSYKVLGVVVALIFIVSTMFPIVSSEDKNLLPVDNEYEMLIPETSSAPCRKPVDVVFALDTSGSMLGADLQNLKDATKLLIGQLTDIDRCAIYTFDGVGQSRPLLQEPYAYMTPSNKTAFNTTIDGFTAGGGTPFYDTLGEALDYSMNNLLPQRLEFVVAMTDGMSISDTDWSPKAEWGNTTTQGYKGLIKPPVMVYTIGLDIIHDPAYPTAPGWSRTPPDPASREEEYDLWHCADSSPKLLHDAGGKYGENKTTGEDNVGHYYYTTDSNQLPNIFDIVYNYILQVSNYLPDSLDIELSEGWNLISVPFVQTNTSIQSVFESIDGKWDIVQYYDANEGIWESFSTFKPANINDLSNVDNTMGIWLHTTESCILIINGTEPTTTLISLYAGWNLVGYPSLTNEIVADALWGTGADRVEVSDTNEPYNLKEIGPTYLMKPGEGYWIHVPADITWIVDW